MTQCVPSAACLLNLVKSSWQAYAYDLHVKLVLLRSACMMQVQQLRRSAVANSSSHAASYTTIADLQRLIDEITGERDALEAQLSDARAAAAASSAARDRAAAESQRAEAACAAAQEQLEQLRASIDDGSASAAAADARAAVMQVSCNVVKLLIDYGLYAR